jgi:hypothetical protein
MIHLQLRGSPQSQEMKLADLSSQASLGFNILASVIGGGFVGYWLAGNLSSDMNVSSHELLLVSSFTVHSRLELQVRLAVGVTCGMTLLIVESVLLVTRLSALDDAHSTAKKKRA